MLIKSLCILLGVVVALPSADASLQSLSHSTNSLQYNSVCSRRIEVQQAILKASGKSRCEEVSQKTLEGITSLSIVGLNELDRRDFSYLSRLQSVEFNGNEPLAQIPPGFFQTFPALIHIAIHQPVNEVMPLAFENLKIPYSGSVYISQVARVHSHAFRNAKIPVLSMNASGTAPLNIDDNAFVNAQIKWFWIVGPRYHVSKDAFTGLSGVAEAILNVSSFTAGAFESLMNASEVRLDVQLASGSPASELTSFKAWRIGVTVDDIDLFPFESYSHTRNGGTTLVLNFAGERGSIEQATRKLEANGFGCLEVGSCM